MVAGWSAGWLACWLLGFRFVQNRNLKELSMVANGGWLAAWWAGWRAFVSYGFHGFLKAFTFGRARIEDLEPPLKS